MSDTLSCSSQTERPARFADSSASVLLDLLRGLAAFLVVVAHWRNLLFVDFPALQAHRILFIVPYVLTNAGHQAVIIFFVLSGFFISRAVFRSTRLGQWSWGDYLVRRIVRLWVVLVPALLLGLLWDRMGLHINHAPALYRGLVENNMMLGDVRAYLTPAAFFGNLFFLQKILTHAFGSNGALWSLACEFWYYILFPLAFLTLRKSTPGRLRCVYVLVLIAIACLLGTKILSLFPVWLAGTALALVPAPRFGAAQGRRARIWAALAYAPLPFIFSRLHVLTEIEGDYLLTAATCLFLWILLSGTDRSDPQAVRVRFSRTIARFSYSLYAAHSPLMIFLVSLFCGDIRWHPTPMHIALGAAMLLVVFCYAFLVASVTEFHTDSVRGRVEGFFRLSSHVSVASSHSVTTSL